MNRKSESTQHVHKIIKMINVYIILQLFMYLYVNIIMNVRYGLRIYDLRIYVFLKY